MLQDVTFIFADQRQLKGVDACVVGEGLGDREVRGQEDFHASRAFQSGIPSKIAKRLVAQIEALSRDQSLPETITYTQPQPSCAL